MNWKILITGSEGMLASDMAKVWSEAGHQVVGLSHSQLDITQPEQVRRAIKEVGPDIVVNTPGIGVDACENHPDEGYRLHSWAAGVLARQCQRAKAVVVYISTCGLFGDEIRFNSEYDPVILKTKYARSKYMGEQETFKACERAYVIRPGWLFGGSPSHQRNFVYQRFLEAQNTTAMRSVNDKIGSPTSTEEFSSAILSILASEVYGLYHVTNSGSASRFDYVKCVLAAFGLDTRVEPVDSSAFPRPAPVPDCELLENLNMKFLGLAPLRPWDEAIERYVAGLPSESKH